MRLTFHCIECDEPIQVILKATNDGLYPVECLNGHAFNLDLLCHHFNILFENAVNAIVDGYFVEAVSSFTASYERFMELFIRVVNESREVTAEEFTKSWKNVSRLSERQFGAFIFVYLGEFGEDPECLGKKYIELRNKVIHKGYFPSESESIAYGNAVLHFIVPIIRKLYESENHNAALIRSVNDTGNFERGMARVHYLHYPMIGVNRPPDTNDRLTVEQLIQQIKSGSNRTEQVN